MEEETEQRHSKTSKGYKPIGINRHLRTFHPKTKEYNLFSAPHGTFSKTDHIVSHKTGLNRYKKMKIIPCILSDDLGLRLVFNNNKNDKNFL